MRIYTIVPLVFQKECYTNKNSKQWLTTIFWETLVGRRREEKEWVYFKAALFLIMHYLYHLTLFSEWITVVIRNTYVCI